MRFIKKLVIIPAFLIIAAGAAAFYIKGFPGNEKLHALLGKSNKPSTEETVNEDKYSAFISEVYGIIKESYWEKISDADLSKIFKLALEKVTGSPAPTEPADLNGVKDMMSQAMKDSDDAKKKETVAKVSDIVLYNLKPAGRSRLYTQKQETALRNNVENVDPATDLYATLGLTKEASAKEIEEAYKKLSAELKNNKSAGAAEKLASIERAHEALAAPEKKANYDKTGAEPTVISKLLTSDIFYMKLTRFSPQSFDELKKAADSIDPQKAGGPTALVFDLRGNIGGAIDILQYFLGPFIGPGNYAYDFFHQGEPTSYKTKYGWFDSLVRYKKVVVLVDGQSQSSAEVMAATLKKYNVGILVGTPTKGWGTVEQVISMDHQLDDSEKFSVFLVHSLTLREDGQPIEGKGVDPTVNITDKNWRKQLLAYFNYPALADAIGQLFK